MSGTRTLRNRSSRYSSPATFAEREVHTKSVEVQDVGNQSQTSLDKWVEPTVRNAVPSFEDTRGLERVGVLEHMAPLGSAPTQKLLQKLKVNLSRTTPRVTPIPLEDTATPPPESRRTEDASSIYAESIPELPTEDKTVLISSPPRGRPAKRDADEMRQVVDKTTPSPMNANFPQTFVSPKRQSIQEHLRQDRMRNIFDRAIVAANEQTNSSRLVPGLQLLFDDARSRSSLWTVIDAILEKTPTDAQFKVFKHYIKKGVRRHRRASGIIASPTLPSNTANHPSFSKPQPVGHAHPFPGHAPEGNTASHDVMNVKSSFHFKTNNSEMYDASKSPRIPPSPQAKAPTMVERPSPAVNGHTQRHNRRSSQKSNSISSTSSLASTLTSIPDDLSSTRGDDHETRVDNEQPVRLAEPRQATNMVAAASRTRSSAVNQPESSHPYSGFPTTIKFVNKKLPKTKPKSETSSEVEQLDTKKRELLGNSFHDYNNIPRPESSERSVVHGLPVVNEAPSRLVPPPVLHIHPVQPSVVVLSRTSNQAPLDTLITNGTSRKRPYDEIDDINIDNTSISSPSTLSPTPSLIPPPPPAVTAVRGTTPRSGRLPPPKQARKSARVMISPNKTKNGAITAGVSRTGPGVEGITAGGPDTGSEDNDEFCASCSGEGILLCCDGCTNSFHHACLEPPLNPDDEVDGEWYCPRCVAQRNNEPLPTRGLLGHVIRQVDDMIPKAYSLPYDVRDYFEGVKTGDEGEYEEVGLPRTQNTGAKMNRAGFIEEPNYKELRDSKGNFITCYLCGQMSNGRDIIPCDYCPAKWHTDCIDPPLAVPPRRRPGDKATGHWRCPLHVDQDLVAVGRQADAAPGDLGRLPRLRKPKHAAPADALVPRGFKNNGVIEVDLMKDDMPEMLDVTLAHGIHRLPERGIRLDFIDRVKKSWYEDCTLPRQMNAQPRIRNRLYRPEQSPLHHPPAYTIIKQREPNFFKGATAISVAETARANVHLRHKSFKEQSAVLGLLSMANEGEVQYGLSIDPLVDLTNSLIANAPVDVEDEINMSEKDRLLRLKQLVDGRLALLQNGDEPDIKNVFQDDGSYGTSKTNGISLSNEEEVETYKVRNLPRDGIEAGRQKNYEDWSDSGSVIDLDLE